MPTDNKRSEIPPKRWKPTPETISLIVALTSIFGLLIAATPVYWSYLCRSQGQYCEGSITPPGFTNENKDEFIARISSPDGKAKFSGLQIKERGNWLFGARADVVAQFHNDTQLVVDTFPNAGDFEILNNLDDNVAAILAEKSPSGALATITVFFPNQQLTKRVFELGCARHSSSGQDFIRVSNLAYTAQNRSLVFDVQTSCAAVAVNNNLSGRAQRYNFDRAPFGATFVLELSENLQVAEFTSTLDKSEFTKSEDAFLACKKRAKDNHGKVEGEVFACYRYRAAANGDGAQLVIFRRSNGELNEAGSTTCSDGVYWSKDPGGKYIFSTCTQRFADSASLGLQIFGDPLEEEKYYYLEGKCKNIDLWRIRFADDKRIVLFELATDCREIVLDDKAYRIRSADGRTRQMFSLYLDSNWMASELRPLSTTGSVGGDPPN